MRKLLSVMLFAVVLYPVAALSGNVEMPDNKSEKSADSPIGLLNEYYAAAKRFDFDTMIALSYGREKERLAEAIRIIERVKEDAARGDEAAKSRWEKAVADAESMTLKYKIADVEGDFAVAGYVLDDSAIPLCYFIMKTDGGWKLVDADDYFDARLKAAEASVKKGLSPSAVVETALASRGSDIYILTVLSYDARESLKRTARYIAYAKAAAVMGDEAAAALLEKGKADAADLKYDIVSEKIDGDFAAVDYVETDRAGVKAHEKAYLRKIDGEWKLIDKDGYAPVK